MGEPGSTVGSGDGCEGCGARGPDSGLTSAYHGFLHPLPASSSIRPVSGGKEEKPPKGENGKGNQNKDNNGNGKGKGKP